MNQLIQNAATKVFKVLGKGHREIIYQNALSVELLKQDDFNTCQQVPLVVRYEYVPVGHVFADMVIFDKKQFAPLSVLELKAQDRKLNDKDMFQLKKYMDILNVPVGYLINFNQKGDDIEFDEFKI
jgi:GxxExxY protein